MGEEADFIELLSVLLALVFPCALAAIIYVALLGQERERAIFIVEYYRQIKINADKERHLATHASKLGTRARTLERQALALMKKERLITLIERPKKKGETPPKAKTEQPPPEKTGT